MMTNKSIQIARFWMRLDETRNTLCNELLPLATHLGVEQEDPGLVEVLEKAAAEAERFLTVYRLQIAAAANEALDIAGKRGAKK